jgi:hypothetical protein
MNGTAESEQLYCANCSDPVDAVDENHHGRCCHNLPNPWHLGSDGLYTQPSESENAAAEDDDEDEDDDERPACPHCGERRFVIHALEWRRIALTTTVSGLDNEDYEDSTLWYAYSDFEDEETMENDGFEIARVTCADCGSDVTDSVNVDPAGS